MPGDLYYGDNLDVLRNKIASESVDLIYLDPPFNSDRTYNLIHRGSQTQERAFVDTWHWEEDAAQRAFAELTGDAPAGVRVPAALTEIMLALKGTLLECNRNTLAYLSMMGIRLVEMHRVLRRTGSLYLHCDPTASHYLKVLLDTIFGPQQFLNDISWKRTTAHNDPYRFGRISDRILYYAKSGQKTFNRVPGGEYSPEQRSRYKFSNSEGRKYKCENLTAPHFSKSRTVSWRGTHPGSNRQWRFGIDELERLLAEGKIAMRRDGCPRKDGLIEFLDEASGPVLQDMWTDIAMPPTTGERIGYQTQKPLELLERIVLSSSNKGDLVLDPFCGCGTTIDACETLERKWIGIDIAIRAIDVVKDRLEEKFGRRIWLEYGEPSGVEEAAHLAESNPYDFQWWAVRKLGGQPPKGERKKGGDGGIDGEMTLQDFASNTRRRVIISVKGGRILTPEMVKSLESTVRLEKADYGILVTMHPPTKGMYAVARDMGAITGTSARSGKLEHRIRIVTVPEILAGAVQLPGLNVTPRSQSSPAPAEARKGETLQLPFPAIGSRKQKAKPPAKAGTNQVVAAKERAQPKSSMKARRAG